MCRLVSMIVVQVQARRQFICLRHPSCTELGDRKLVWSQCNLIMMSTVECIAVLIRKSRKEGADDVSLEVQLEQKLLWVKLLTLM